MHAERFLARTISARDLLVLLLLILALGLAGGWAAGTMLSGRSAASATAEQVPSGGNVPHSEHVFPPPTSSVVGDQPTRLPPGCSTRPAGNLC
jgi:hypothetical protein